MPNLFPPHLNTRKAVRYARDDIKAMLYRQGLFRSGRPFAVELLDISTRGAHIASPVKLSVNSALILKIIFEDGQMFEIAGKVVHKQSTPEYKFSYGLRFNATQDALGDYLLETQTELIFK